MKLKRYLVIAGLSVKLGELLTDVYQPLANEARLFILQFTVAATSLKEKQQLTLSEFIVHGRRLLTLIAEHQGDFPLALKFSELWNKLGDRLRTNDKSI